MPRRSVIDWDDPRNDESLRTYWENGYADWEIADAMEVESYEAIRYRRRQLGLVKRRGYYRWPHKDRVLLQDNLHLTNKELAELLGKTINSVIQYKKDKGMKKRYERD